MQGCTAFFLVAALLQSSGCGQNKALPTADKFAVKCEGTSEHQSSDIQNGIARSGLAGPHTYIIDSKKREVLHALEPRQQFEPVCGVREDKYEADISPGLIQVNFSQPSKDGIAVDCSFSLDRKSGQAEFELNLEFEGGVKDKTTWNMTCERSEIPSFDTARNKF